MSLPSVSRRTLIVASVALVVLATAATSAATGYFWPLDKSTKLASQINPSAPKNVILLVGDGTDESIITAARNYELGADGAFELDKLPFVGDMTTHGLKVGPGPDYQKAYVSDSAPTASAWSTGEKTVDSRISQGPSVSDTTPGTDFRTVMMEWRDRGARTGNVSSAEITDATPAAAASNINLRGCQGPANMAQCTAAKKSNGGKGSIAEQLVDNELDVILGGGLGRFTQATDAGPTVLDYAVNTKGYKNVATAAELANVNSLANGPVLGLFATGNMTPRYSPLVATAPPGAGDATTRCQNADRGTQPTLGAMTKKAIDLLDNRKGFFLQVESAMVDKQEHGADICGAIGDVSELDDALKAALEFKRRNPSTLIIVTADHSHSTQIVSSNSGGRQTATLLTADGDPMSVAYSTQAAGSAHTGSSVRIAAVGPQAANVTGLIDQTDLYDTLLGGKPGKHGH